MAALELGRDFQPGLHGTFCDERSGKVRLYGDFDLNGPVVEDRAVDEAVALQIHAGLDVITDGEMRRYAFFGHLIDATEGFDKFGGWAIPFYDDEGDKLVFQRPVVVAKLRRIRPLCEEEYTYLDLKLNVGLTDTDFSPDNVAYNYPRL